MPSHATPERICFLTIGLIVAAYWYRVLRMARKQRRKTGRAANLIPTEPLGRLLRVIWLPVIVVWIIHPLQASLFPRSGWLQPIADMGWATVIPTSIVVVGWLLTRVCWRRMGKSWRMGIDPGERTELVVSGAFAYVRHPIYTLSALMMAATAVALPSELMWVVAVTHIALLYWESSREERHLLAVHGESYQRYRRSVGRLIPRNVKPYQPQV